MLDEIGSRILNYIRRRNRASTKPPSPNDARSCDTGSVIESLSHCQRVEADTVAESNANPSPVTARTELGKHTGKCMPNLPSQLENVLSTLYFLSETLELSWTMTC